MQGSKRRTDIVQDRVQDRMQGMMPGATTGTVRGTALEAEPQRQAVLRCGRHRHAGHAFLCAALVMQGLLMPGLVIPGLMALPGMAEAQEPAQSPAVHERAVQHQAVQEPVQAKALTPARDDALASPEADGKAGTDAAGRQLPAIADFAPGSVYSGTLGELTRLQAGQEMARATLSLKEIQARILDVEKSMAKARRELDEQKAAEEAASQPSLQEAMKDLRSGLESLAEDVAALRLEKEKARDLANTLSCLVLSVRSLSPQGSQGSQGSQGAKGSGLVAEIATREGRFLAGPGDRVPGVGRIDKVTRTKVTAEGRTLPWK